MTIKCPICNSTMLCKLQYKESENNKGTLRFYTLACSCCEYKTHYIYKKLEDAVKEVLTTTKGVEKVMRDIAVMKVSEILDE